MFQEGVAIEIAEAVVGALQGELSATAVNAPMVPLEVTNLYNENICLQCLLDFTLMSCRLVCQVLSELAPYMILAEKLGRLAVQLVAGGSGIKCVKIVYRSSRSPDDLDTRILRAMITKGIIEPISSVFVNLVNADFAAKQRGLRISEERIFYDSSLEIPLNSIEVELSNVESKFASAISDNGSIRVVGMVKDGDPHLTTVGTFGISVSLEGSIILCRQIDQPGMIGMVGSLLGESNVNVSFMSVGRTVVRNQAIMAIGVDEEPDKETLGKIGDINAIDEFVFFKL